MKRNSILAIILMSALLTACQKEQLIDELKVTEQTNAVTAQSTETSASVSAIEPPQTTLVGLAENTAATSETTSAEEENAENEAENEGEEMVLTFIECLKTGRSNFEHGELGYGDPFEVYDFWDDFTLDAYSFDYRGDGIYDVTLTCSDSNCEMFPNGVSEWVFNSTYQTCFIPAEREENHNTTMSFSDPDFDGKDSTLYSSYYAAMNFSLYTGAFEADSEWFENYTDVNVHGFFHAYNPYFTVNDYENGVDYDVTPEEFAAAVKKMYNVNMTVEQAQSMTDETGFLRKDCAHGGSWLYDELAGFEETEDEVKVTVNYYGDSLYFYPTIQSEYTFSKNDDDTITLQNVEKIFDNGYEPAGGAI